MKNLLKILAVGTVIFMVFGIAQDWRNFFRMTPEARRDDPAVQAAANDAVRSFISMASHAYRSGGDPRFVERVPATDAVRAELVEELTYLQKHQRVQISELTTIETLSVDLLSPTRAIVRTREQWLAHTESAVDGSRLEPAQEHTVYAEYRVELYAAGWRVAGWDHVPPPPPPEDAGATGEGT